MCHKNMLIRERLLATVTRKATPMLDYLSLTVIPDGVISTINTVSLRGICEPFCFRMMSLNSPVEAFSHGRSRRSKSLMSGM
jgi:hypothetical protein